MKRFVNFSSIDQFRSVVRNVNHHATILGYDENDKPIRDQNPKIPIVKAVATEKIHGTNGGVCFSNAGGFWVQNKSRVLTLEEDNAQCAEYAMKIENEWIDIIMGLANEYDINLDEKIIAVYFEWCGAGIQKKTAVSGIKRKLAMVFSHFKVAPIEADESIPSVWMETKINGEWISDHDAGIFNINEFPTYEFDIDFKNPFMIQNDMIAIVEKTIEPASPVGKEFGFDTNIGEGMVVTFMYKDTLHRFKVKGEKHAGNTKVKTLKPVDNEKLQKINDIAEKVTPVWRLQQMFDEANDTINGGMPAMENMGLYMKLVNTDIIKEEMDTIEDAGLIPKEIFKAVSHITRPFYVDKLDEAVFGK